VKVKKLAQDMYEEEGIENVFLPTTRSSLSRNYRYPRPAQSAFHYHNHTITITMRYQYYY